jgi:hypothetical protein
MKEARNALITMVYKPLVKQPLARPNVRWEDNNEMHLKEMGSEGGICKCDKSTEYRDYFRYCNFISSLYLQVHTAIYFRILTSF